ncbi:MAG: DNA polymerase III subunit [Polyangiaceae bacterium]|nr:DNA polymerase III subunit [Polyangiaceae bacterium]
MVSVFDKVRGQEPAISTLRRAISSGRVHHAYRFEGPDGVGRERAALALGCALLCEEQPDGCGVCRSCKRVLQFSEEEPNVPLHPDVILIGRALYPPGMIGGKSEAMGISVEQIRRLVLSRVGYAPHEGKALVVIIRGAHELTTSAANALLKTLEEPIARVHFILITNSPGRLLDTVRSRTQAVRFSPLPEPILRKILEAQNIDTTAVDIADGSASVAIALSQDDVSRERDDYIDALNAAIDAPTLAPAIALNDGKAKDRTNLREKLDAFAQHLSERTRAAVATDPQGAATLARRYEIVTQSMNHLERNAQPALVIEGMVRELRRS